MAGDKFSIVLVDDNDAQRYATARVLRSAGFEVIEGQTGQAALELAERHADLVVLDVNLPDLSGIEVCRRLKTQPATTNIPVLHISATYTRPEDRAYALDSGADGYLVNPVEPHELIATARALIRLHRAEEDRRKLVADVNRHAQQLDEILSASSEQIYMFDSAARFTYANASGLRALGLELSGIVGKTWRELGFSPALMEPFEAHLRQVFASGKEGRGESAFFSEAERRLYEYVLTPIRGGGTVASVVATLSDVTEHHQVLQRERQARAQAEAAEKRITAILESITDAFLTLDHDWRFTYVNAEAERLLQRSREQLLGGVAWELYPGAESFKRHYEEAIATARSVHFDEFYAPLGNRWFGVHAYPSREGLSVYFHDVTERKQMEEALRLSETRLRLALDAANAGTWELNLHTGQSVWSEELWALYGLSPGSSQPSYENWLKTVHPDDRQMADRTTRDAIASGTELDLEYRTLFADGTVRWILGRGRVVRDQHGEPVSMVGINMDITERKRTEETLRTTEKFAATGRLAATLAHEINNPMAAVTNLMFLLAADSNLGREARTYLDLAQAELARMAHITKQMLGFYRETQAPVPMRVADLLEDVLQVYARRIGNARVHVKTEYEFRAEINSYPGDMRQVFSNLLVNALDAMEENGGRIRVRVAWAREWDGRAREGVRILLADNGPGIRREDRKRIFEPFFTTKGERGTGLGLWVTQGVVEKMGGTIRVRSSTRAGASGTCFSIFLPIEAQGKGGAQRAAAE